MSPDVRRTKEYVMTSVQNGGSVKAVPKSMKTDKDVCIASAKSNGNNYAYFTNEARRNEDIAAAAIRNTQHAYKLTPKEIRNSPKVVEARNHVMKSTKKK